MNNTDHQAPPAPSFTLGHADALKCLKCLKCLKQQLLIASTTFQALREKETALQELLESFRNEDKRFAAQEQQIQNLYAQINMKNKAIEEYAVALSNEKGARLVFENRLKRLKKTGKKVGKRK